MIHGVTVRILHDPPLEQLTALFQRLRADGADAVSIVLSHYVSLVPGTPNLTLPPPGWVPPWFIWPDRGQDPGHPYANTPKFSTTYDACQAAQAAGLHVLLKPHIDSYQADWRGNISVAAHAADWAWGYRRRFLAPYVAIARELGTDLCLGCELYTVTKELGVGFWLNLADWVRSQGFHGPLTYAANWGGWADDAEYRRLAALWPHLDYIGVDAYFPLVPLWFGGPLDIPTLVAGWHRQGLSQPWCPRIDDDLIALSRSAGRPLLFTEIGYPNDALAAENPGRDALRTDVRDDGLQLRLAEAFRQRWGGVPEFGGYFWWEAALPGVITSEISHNILGQPLEAVVFQPLPGEPAAG